MNYRGRITNSRLLASSVTMLAINCGLYSANRSIMAQANANLGNGPRRPKEATLQGRSIARARTTPANICYAENIGSSSRAQRGRREMVWLPSGSSEQNSTSAFATWPCANRGLLFLRAPAIDYIDAEAPFRTDPKTGQLFSAQQSIHGSWMYPQIFGEFPHCKYRRRGWR